MGYLSDDTDRSRLLDPAWRVVAANGIADAVQHWLAEDAAHRQLVRQ